MKDFATCRHTLRALCIALALALTSLATDGGMISTAHAQEAGERRGGGLLRFLFPRPEKRERPVAPTVKKKRPPAQRRAVAPPAPPPPPAVEKAENARRILVIGDFIASSLADGLATAYGENANMLVLDRTNGSSGLVRDDYYDWPGNITAILDTEKPAAVVVMIGANDRQQLLVGGNRESPGSEAWAGEYERRIKTLAMAVRDRELPLFWVGALPFKSSIMSSDMIAFNDLYRRIVTDSGGEFIDVWDGFINESGTFAANGPDMNGQPAQLRGSDGISVTRPGRRKIAFYIEKPLARLFGLDGSDGSIGLPPDPDLEPGSAPLPADPAVIDRTQPVAIDDTGAEPGAILLGATVKPASLEAKTPAALLARKGIAPEARPGRADDFSSRGPPSDITPTALSDQK